jgi:AcrR family transcriptional regulator
VRREELLDTAFKLFQKLGYERTSVQTITDEIGVAKGLFYHYFSSKADLLNQLAGWQADIFISSLPRAAEMEGTGVEKLRSLSKRITQWKFEDTRELTRAYLEVMYREENRSLRVALFSETAARLLPLYAEIIAQMVEEGDSDVTDPQLTAELIFGLGIATGDRNAELLLELPRRPENLGELLARLRAWENAIERLLGMPAGALQVYDFAYIEKALVTLLQEEADDTLKGRS